jgi:AcrR family transcriptional regulator
MSNLKAAKLSSAEERRQLILEAAERLFAHKGINAVSLNEINKAAGQKNTSALHYHFGSREALIDAIVDQHHAGLMAQLEAPLEELLAAPGRDISLRQILSTYVAPYITLLDDERGRCHIQIVTQLLYIDVDLVLEPRAINQRARLESLITSLIPRTSADLRNMLSISFVHVLFNTLSLYCQMGVARAEKVYGSRESFENNLVTVLAAILMVA